jgi:hypothetical protein
MRWRLLDTSSAVHEPLLFATSENTVRSAFELDGLRSNGSTSGMQGENPERAPWDEGAALAELERLHRAIDEWRTRRKDAGAAFDEFVSGFRTPAREPEKVDSSLTTRPRVPDGAPGLASALDAPLADSPRSVTSATVAEAASSAEPLVPTGVPSPVPAEFPLSSIVSVLVKASTLPAEQRKRRARLGVVAGGVVVLAAAGVLLIRSWQATPAGSGVQARPAPQPAVRVPLSAVPPPGQKSGPVDSSAPRTEITALRRVWVRVVVDGTSEVERELQPQDRVPLRPGRTSVIRAGDAGAIRLTINGKDQGPLGDDGEVLTRTVKVPAPPNR